MSNAPTPATSYVDDGKIIAGSFIATIKGQSYIVNSLELDSPIVAVERNDEHGRLDAKRHIKDYGRRQGTCEIQVNESSQHIDLHLAIFEVPADYNSSGAAIKVIIESDPSSVSATDPRTRSLTIRQLCDQTATVTPATPTPPEE